MLTIKARNVHQALPEMLYQLRASGVRRESRNGPVLVFPHPVVVEYTRPQERVMFWPERDCNPFFHFFEALWMLGGRNDVAFPVRFNSTFGQFSDDGVTFNAAYGHRWRRYFGYDQLEIVAQRLRDNPDDRRVVLGMWDPHEDLGSSSKDVPCNLSACFQRGADGELNMTVYNRSNDIVWGALGANAVHFSVLQEFLALAIGCPVGRYWQISCNMHGYLKTVEPLMPLADRAFPSTQTQASDPYEQGVVQPLEMFPSGTGGDFVSDLAMFLDEGERAMGYKTKFMRRVAMPLLRSWLAFKDSSDPARFHNARKIVQVDCHAKDWSLACDQWLARREEKARAKAAATQEE